MFSFEYFYDKNDITHSGVLTWGFLAPVPFIVCLCDLQIDVLEDPVIRNVIILQTVLQEVRHRSAPVYKRLKDMIHEKEKHFYTFTNEHHRL